MEYGELARAGRAGPGQGKWARLFQLVLKGQRVAAEKASAASLFEAARGCGMKP